MTNPPKTSIFVSPEGVRINGQKVYVSEDTLDIEHIDGGITAVTLTLLVDDLYVTTKGIQH